MDQDQIDIRQAERFEKKSIRYANKGKKNQAYYMAQLASKLRHGVKLNNESKLLVGNYPKSLNGDATVALHD